MSEYFAELRDTKSEQGTIEERLSRHPHLKARIASLSDTIENVGNDVEKADAAEQRVIGEVRCIGQEALQGWAEGQVKKKSEELYDKISGIRCHDKKNFIGTPSSEQ